MTNGGDRERGEPHEPTEGPPAAPGPAARANLRDARPGPPPAARDDRNAGWVIISRLVAGMIIYGGLGRLIGQWAGAARVTTLVGVLVGLVLALALVIYRYGGS